MLSVPGREWILLLDERNLSKLHVAIFIPLKTTPLGSFVRMRRASHERMSAHNSVAFRYGFRLCCSEHTDCGVVHHQRLAESTVLLRYSQQDAQHRLGRVRRDGSRSGKAVRVCDHAA